MLAGGVEVPEAALDGVPLADDAGRGEPVGNVHRVEAGGQGVVHGQRHAVVLDLTGAREKSYWLVLERPEVSVCWTDPGFEPDLFVTADTVALHRIWVGQLPLAPALRDGLIDVDGPDELRRAFPDWLKLSVFTERG